jgi:DNA polymerase/3'-5' exonuclease PolX
MSAGTKQPLAHAIERAEAFRALFYSGSYMRWELAGSVRRKCPSVGDIEAVIIPAWGGVTVADGLFTKELANVNLLWHRLDSLVEDGKVSKWVRDNGRTCWGEKTRAVNFAGQCFEIYTATENTWGSTMAIRTGPREFSMRLVTAFLPRGLRAEDGYLRRGIELIPCPDEAAYMAAAGFKWIAPEARR